MYRNLLFILTYELYDIQFKVCSVTHKHYTCLSGYKTCNLVYDCIIMGVQTNTSFYWYFTLTGYEVGSSIVLEIK